MPLTIFNINKNLSQCCKDTKSGSFIPDKVKKCTKSEFFNNPYDRISKIAGFFYGFSLCVDAHYWFSI